MSDAAVAARSPLPEPGETLGPPLVELAGVGRRYEVGGGELWALRDIDLTIPRGELIVLMGASGSGKSTLLNVLGCLDRPSVGTYRFEGEAVEAMSEAELVRLRRTRMGFVFQAFHLIARMTARRNVELPMILAGVDAGERRARALKALEDVGLAPRVDHRPDELSGGEKQRVAIARALAMDPPVILADEPTGNLDSKAGDEVMRLLLELNRAGRTIAMVTHDPRLERIGHRRIQLLDGRIIDEARWR